MPFQSWRRSKSNFFLNLPLNNIFWCRLAANNTTCVCVCKYFVRLRHNAPDNLRLTSGAHAKGTFKRADARVESSFLRTCAREFWLRNDKCGIATRLNIIFLCCRRNILITSRCWLIYVSLIGKVLLRIKVLWFSPRSSNRGGFVTSKLLAVILLKIFKKAG